MEIPFEYVGHSIKVNLNNVETEVIFAGWCLGVVMVQLLDDEGHLNGQVKSIRESDVIELPDLCGEPPAIYCPPHDKINV